MLKKGDRVHYIEKGLNGVITDAWERHDIEGLRTYVNFKADDGTYPYHGMLEWRFKKIEEPRDHDLDRIFKEVEDEFTRASSQWPPFVSTHEGYAIILEELDEVWDEVKKRDLKRMEEELVQVIAMSTRLLYDIRKNNVRAT